MTPNYEKIFQNPKWHLFLLKTGDVHEFYHVTIWVLESTADHLQIVYMAPSGVIN